jgi:hypothetical protein
VTERVALAPLPIFALGGVGLVRSMPTFSPYESSPDPLFVAQAVTPKAPRYRFSGMDPLRGKGLVTGLEVVGALLTLL